MRGSQDRRPFRPPDWAPPPPHHHRDYRDRDRHYQNQHHQYQHQHQHQRYRPTQPFRPPPQLAVLLHRVGPDYSAPTATEVEALVAGLPSPAPASISPPPPPEERRRRRKEGRKKKKGRRREEEEEGGRHDGEEHLTVKDDATAGRSSTSSTPSTTTSEKKRQSLDVDHAKRNREPTVRFASTPTSALPLFEPSLAVPLAAAVHFRDLGMPSTRACVTAVRRPRDTGHHLLALELPDPALAAHASPLIASVFAAHASRLLESGLLAVSSARSAELAASIKDVKRRLASRNRFRDFDKLILESKTLEAEKDLLDAKIAEYQVATRSIRRAMLREAHDDEEGVDVFGAVQGAEVDFARVHKIMLRECRRLKEGLPIYAYRRRILNHIFTNQVMILIGETGSGKSTQLVQFLADSGLAVGGSIVCTQPRKIAAISLAHRVDEESNGCYGNNSVISYSTLLNSQGFGSKVVFTTDSCLLHHCMNDKGLDGISYIIVDEAHERSLNTDLLLAMIKNRLLDRLDLRLIIMSATADADRLAEYFYGCQTFHVKGRTFPVEIKYVPDISAEASFNTLPKLVFKSYPGKRKIIFCTNIAETSLTIKDVKYVVDCGLAKEYRFIPSSGLNVLKVNWISQSSANQRAGRAGRTGAGKCYRLYSESDFGMMEVHQEPEIRKIHLGTAVLRILALGIGDVQNFEFVDAPDPEAINTAVNNLEQLGAIEYKHNQFELTDTARHLVKLGIEPRLGKIMLDCFSSGLMKEGVVLAAVMANSSSIFCRVGTNEEKYKADRLKVPFCHPDGDLFTSLAVYKKWEEGDENKNAWCWQNSINAKTLRSYWRWNPEQATLHDALLKRIILSSLRGNLAMFSGHEKFGYQVISADQPVQLHPSCSLFIYDNKPEWVVFAEILSIPNQYLVCVTAVDHDALCTVHPMPSIKQLEMNKLQRKVITGIGNKSLRRFCGKSGQNLHKIVSMLREACDDDRITVDIDFDANEVLLFAKQHDMEKVVCIVNDALEFEAKLLRNECDERRPGCSVLALFGSGAEIKQLELEKRYVTVEILHQNACDIDEKELICLVDAHVPGLPFPAVRAKVSWPRKPSRGLALVTCASGEAEFVVKDCFALGVGGRYVNCEVSKRFEDRVFVTGVPFHVTEPELYDAFRSTTTRRILDIHLLRGSPTVGPSVSECEEALMREISIFMPNKNFPGQNFRVQAVGSLLESFRSQKGVSYNLEKNENGIFRVKLTANATKTIADMRRPLELLMEGKTINHPDLTLSAVQLLLSRDGLAHLRSVENETGTYIHYDRQTLNIKIYGHTDQVAAAEEKLVHALLQLHEKKPHEIRLRGRSLPPNLMKEVIKMFGADLEGLKKEVHGAELQLNTRRHVLYVRGSREDKQRLEEMISELITSRGHNSLGQLLSENSCPICFCELEDPFKLESCAHTFCKACLVDQCESAMKSQDGFPLCCLQNGCKKLLLLVDLRSLLPDKLDELFRASLNAFVASSAGLYRFCPTPDCMSIYQVAAADAEGKPFVCGACHVEICTKCHFEYHPFISCEAYKEYKADPDSTLVEWRKGKENVKNCPSCGYTIEKTEGCNHVECRCGSHICWACLENFKSSEECYGHLRSVHLSY
ncbi:hypothetical protein HU200_005175 [Digitaria exilis]|uniref:RNA helicase n=1 Tax=Digitaria exilis TaxID=1010633 RepID=A0A835FSA1_9POAL|nr:hypothetical protein HU200_005175 [Digitaria exilis]